MSNPFQMSESVRSELVRMAEQSGSRAITWNLSYFNKVGGRGTLTSVWNRLKSMCLVRGEKRSCPSDSDDCDDRKKFKQSLNLSDTCDLINNIELQGENELSREVTDSDRSRDDEPIEVILDSPSDASFGSVLLLSDNDSMPLLAARESVSQGLGRITGSETDSGLTDDCVGGVTNLCRERREHSIRSGIVTETGPFIPVSLGFSQVDMMDSDWEEVFDDNGQPTGVERRCFRLNVRDGRTESIDDDWSSVRHMNGIPDETTSRRRAGGRRVSWWEQYLDDEVEIVNHESYVSGNLDEMWSVEYEWSEPPRATLMQTRWSGVEDNRWSEPPRATLIETDGGGERYNRWTEPTRATLRYSEGGNGMLGSCSQSTFESSNMSMSNEEEVGGLNLRRPVSGVETCWDVWTVLLSEHSLFLMTMMMTVTGIWDVWGAVLGGGTWAASAVRNNLN